jgi:hypothetical protein
MKEEEMGGGMRHEHALARMSTHGTAEKCMKSLVRILEGKRSLVNLAVDDSTILKWFLEKSM